MRNAGLGVLWNKRIINLTLTKVWNLVVLIPHYE